MSSVPPGSTRRIHVHTMVLRYTVEENGGIVGNFELSFDLSSPDAEAQGRRIGSLFFDDLDYGRSTDFHSPRPRYEIDPVRPGLLDTTKGTTEQVSWITGPVEIGDPPASASAARVRAHEEDTCDWIVLR